MKGASLKHLLPLDLGLKDREGLLHERPAQVLLVVRSKGRIPKGADDLLGR